jgi:pilus assembly protein CpaC
LIATGLVPRTLVAFAALAVFQTAAARIAFAQAGGKDFRAKVVDLTGHVDQIVVPLFGTVTVETTLEATRADVISKNVADVQVISPTRMLITGQGYGKTTVLLWSADQKQHAFEVSVELDLGRLNNAIKDIDPLSTAKSHSVLGNVVLTGAASSAERAKRIVEVANLFLPPPVTGKQATVVQNHLDVAGEQQVLLRCVVAEVSRAAVRDLGINGFLAGEHFNDVFVVNQVASINPINMGAAAGQLVTQDMAFLTGEDGVPLLPSTTMSLGFPQAQMQLFIRAMAENSLLKVLAEPNLVAISGETATFLAGGEFPIPVPQGNQQVTIDFRQFGVRLNFTPLVRGDDRIRLRVAPEVSELDFTTAVFIEGFAVPGLKSRAAETTIELASGETIGIAGLLSEEVRALAQRVPALGDIPVLGALFRSVNYRRSMTELVILVTPEIVAPLDTHQRMALPTDGMVAPNDFELYGLGKIDGSEKVVKEADGVAEAGATSEFPKDDSTLHGPWGHARPESTR